jgi:hypothetical protein
MKRIIFSALFILYAAITFGQQTNIPPAIQVSKTNKLILHTYAKGVQVYVCKQDAKDTSHYNWIFKEPRPVLYADSVHRQVIGKHYFDAANNPTWENTDGSKVSGAKVAQVNSTDSSAIPWLLLKAINNQRTGVLTATAFIQRIFTKGGKAPAEADPTLKGTSLEVPYEAEYLFYSGE